MPIQHLKLYHAPASRSTRAKWVLHEALGDTFEVQRVDLNGAEQYGPDFLSINPHHAVPVLEITWADGTMQRLTESAAIVTFVADAYPAAALAPNANAARQRADYLQVMQLAATTMDMMLWHMRMHAHVLPADEQDPRTLARYRSKFVAEAEPPLHERLSRAAFACGEQFSAADCMLGHTLFWARGYGLCQDAVFASYMARLSQRPAFKQAFADVREFVLDARGSPLSQHFTG
nr:glutathione S-transferase family protein [uncultured Rhodoferax sp.]